MPGLYFLGVKKSTIKKIPPFKYLFDWRDKKNFQKLLEQVEKNYQVKEVSKSEKCISYPLNNKELSLYFRQFPASDLSVFDQVFLHHCYLPIIEKTKELFNESDVLRVIDAGANVGYASVYFKTFFPNAEVVAIEPEETNARQIQKNLQANNLQLSRLINGGLWNKNAFLEVVKDFRDNREASLTVKETAKQTNIKGYGFREILSQNGWEEVDFVKIDIEGSERFLFDTDENADNILAKTKFIAIEIHDEFDIRPTIYGHLNRNGFSYFEFEDLTLAINHKKLSN